jgi:glycine betaine/choline ABC-type transport system substrate-binding protein
MCEAVAEGRWRIARRHGQSCGVQANVLRDDRGFFLAVRRAPVVRGELGGRTRNCGGFDALGGTIDDATMRSLNHQWNAGSTAITGSV